MAYDLSLLNLQVSELLQSNKCIRQENTDMVICKNSENIQHVKRKWKHYTVTSYKVASEWVASKEEKNKNNNCTKKTQKQKQKQNETNRPKQNII